ncbi:MAG TPA: Yip1 family protein [Xanthobacteraceae bacterium]|nr:Yip1 family protein [Xanthobacteraceae bacterium]
MTLIDRVKNIILRPKAEWPVIDREPGDAAYLFKNYVAILAAIPAICGFIGTSLIGLRVPGMETIRMPVGFGLGSAIIGYLLTFLIVYAVALIVDALAKSFGGRKHFESALKLTVYSYTPAWLCGFFFLIPALSFLSIFSLYGLYLLWLGLPVLMKAPQEKSLLYAGAVVICAIVLGVILGFVQGALFAFPQIGAT